MSTLRKFGEASQRKLSLSNLGKLAAKSPTSYKIDNFTQLADSYVNAPLLDLVNVEKQLKAWFCFKFNTTLNDERLQDMTLEELLLNNQMHQIRENPELVAQSESDDYEEWLKKEMGEEYISDDDMVQGMEKEEKDFTKRIKAQFPDKIRTDFSQFQQDE